MPSPFRRRAPRQRPRTDVATEDAQAASSRSGGQRRGRHAAVPRLGVSPRFLIGLVLITVAAGATDVWLSRRSSSEAPPASSGTGSDDGDELTPSPAVIATPDPYTSVVAEAKVAKVRIFKATSANRPWKTLEHPTSVGGPLVFLVDQNEGDWLKVLLPVRPNGSKGWIRADDVTLSEHRYRIVISLEQHRLTVFEGGEVIMRRPIGVGTRDTPTPGGTYYIKELLKPPTPNSVYGTYAYGLSGFSNVFRSFNGGEGVIGLHGTNDPSSIGSDVSAGCIRMHNKDIERLVKILPLGTPVTIVK